MIRRVLRQVLLGYRKKMSSLYLDFRRGMFSKTGKTKIVSIYSKKYGNLLAEIRWFGRWRQYALFPEDDTVFNFECLENIQDEITRLMNERDDKSSYDRDYVDVYSE